MMLENEHNDHEVVGFWTFVYDGGPVKAVVMSDDPNLEGHELSTLADLPMGSFWRQAQAWHSSNTDNVVLVARPLEEENL